MRAVASLILVACEGGGASPLFPADYATRYVEVRGCRPSSDHDLTRIRVLADPQAASVYVMRDRQFPVGTVLLKEERDYADATCSGSIERWSVMVQLAPGSSPSTLDWRWQQVDAARAVIEHDEPRCFGCHTNCGQPPDGYLGTCTVP